MQKKNFLTTGEFARVCRTTKETLFHYDRENLLKPKYVSGNGYRYYGMEQFFDFDMISMFKETGSSLKEVKAYIDDKDGENLLLRLEDRLRIVQKERARLAQREIMLRDMVAGTREALDFVYDTVMIMEQKEERLEIVQTDPTPAETEADIVNRFTAYMDYYDQQNREPRSPFGVLMEQADVQKGLYRERYYFSRATRATPRSMLHIKPGGSYAVMASKGNIAMHLAAYAKLLAHIQANSLRIAGNCYCYDMMSYVLQEGSNEYRAKFCVRVE